jgi:signal transduction histidine kinase
MNVAESQCPEVRHLRLRSGSSPHSPCKETQLIFAPPQTLPSEMQDILEDAAGWNREAPCPTTLCVLVLPKDGAGLTEKGLQQHKLTNLGALAAGIAHDLNNLFTGMGAFTHLLKGEIEDSKLLGYLETVEQTLDKSSKLTQSITNFLREDSSVIAPSDPVSCLRDILYIVRRTLQAGATLNVQLPPESYNIPVLRSELNQVFLNLLINARDALVDGGHISVEARFEPTERPKHFVLHIEDTGIGIPAENLGLIFEPFFSTKGEQGGTGLGLNVVQSIVQRAGGQISVHSAPGAGTSFFVRLPVANNPFPLNNSN